MKKRVLNEKMSKPTIFKIEIKHGKQNKKGETTGSDNVSDGEVA